MPRMSLVAASSLAILVAGCGRDERATPATQKTAAGSATAGDPCARAELHGTLKWIADDYPAALACARAKKLPIVLDLWAPWCHTCISMRTTVFTEPSLAPRQEQFVFLAVDTDRELNAAAVGKYALSAWPTFYVISPDEQVLARFVGAATLEQFTQFLEAGKRAMAGGIAAADARLLGAERALAQKDLPTADEELTAALATAPADWPRRAEAAASLQSTKKKRGDALGCVELSDRYLDLIGQSATATNFWARAIQCVAALAQDPPAGADLAKAKAVQDRAIAKLQIATDDENAPLSVDDRAEALSHLRDAYAAHGETAKATATAERLRTLLDDAWAKAPTPFARMTFLWPRAEVYSYLERPLDLVDDYARLAAELPGEYDPPARLGWLYLRAGKHAEAATWTDKALALVYGPRKARLLGQRAEIAAGAGDRGIERAMREQAVKLWESLPPEQQSADALAKARAALAALDASAGAGSADGTAAVSK